MRSAIFLQLFFWQVIHSQDPWAGIKPGFFRNHYVRRWSPGERVPNPSTIIIRHANAGPLPNFETNHDMVSLTEEGKLLCNMFGKYFRDKPLNTFISSPHKPCKDTIDLISKAAEKTVGYTTEDSFGHSAFHREQDKVINLIKEIGHDRLRSDHTAPWLNGKEHDFLHPLRDRAEELMVKHNIGSDDGITLICAHYLTIEAIARAANLREFNDGSWSDYMEGLLITPTNIPPSHKEL